MSAAPWSSAHARSVGTSATTAPTAAEHARVVAMNGDSERRVLETSVALCVLVAGCAQQPRRLLLLLLLLCAAELAAVRPSPCFWQGQARFVAINLAPTVARTFWIHNLNLPPATDQAGRLSSALSSSLAQPCESVLISRCAAVAAAPRSASWCVHTTATFCSSYAVCTLDRDDGTMQVHV